MDEIKKLAQRAIDAALLNQWQEAVKLNQKIIKKDPKNVPALNRLTKAFLELGKKKDGRATIKKVLSIDKFNPIALKNLNKIGVSTAKKGFLGPSDPDLFIEEPGKTKTISLINLADKAVINKLAIGEEVKLVPRQRRISLLTQTDVYIGKLPDDSSQRLISLIKGGNKYQAFIRSTSDGVKVFLRETFRSKKFANFPSFVSQESEYQSFTPPDLVHEEPPEMINEDEELD